MFNQNESIGGTVRGQSSRPFIYQVSCVSRGYHVPRAALGTGHTFTLSVSDISRNGRSLAHTLPGTILMVPVTFIRELNEQNFAK